MQLFSGFMLHINTQIGVVKRTPFIWKYITCYSISMVKLSAQGPPPVCQNQWFGGTWTVRISSKMHQLNFSSCWLTALGLNWVCLHSLQSCPQTWRGPYERLKNTPCCQSFTSTARNTTYYSAHTWMGSPRLSRVSTDHTETKRNTLILRKAVFCQGGLLPCVRNGRISARGK